MKYIDICKEEEIVSRLEELSSCQVAKVPLANINPKTSYWVSYDGKSAYVLHLILNKFYINNITITKSGYRSKKSRPFFKVRTNKGYQLKVTLDRAVYGAFILKNKMPDERRSIGLKDFDLDNCSAENLETESERKEIINRLICFFSGHKYVYYKTTRVINLSHGWVLLKCTRCGKTKEKYI